MSRVDDDDDEYWNNAEWLLFFSILTSFLPFLLLLLLHFDSACTELNKAIGHDRRIAAITNACAEFDHWDEAKHNAELQYGSANALSLHLSMSDDDDEIRMICAALEMVFRASGDVVRTSFQEVGSAIVPMLLRLLERCESGNMKHADVSILNITKVLLYFSRVTELRVTLVRHQGLLAALVRVSTSILNAECRTIRMRVLANLANPEDNKGAMLEHTGLVESVLKVAALDLSEGAREYASQALMDLASTPLNQAIMAKNDRLLGTLVKLSVIDDKAETREYAVTALQNLAFSKENRTRLVTYGSGVVLEALKKTVSSDPNDKARRRAAGALTNLACEDTADRMGSHKGLLETLSDVSSKDTNSDVQERAVLALTKIATSVTVQMGCFGALLDALLIAMSKKASGISAVLRVKARVMENRNRMAHHPNLLETLSEISINQSGRHSAKDRDNAIRVLMHLTNDNTNRKTMCRTVVLNALVKAAALTGSANSDARDSAVIAIERLATEQSNRAIMARHDGLLVVIALATEREAKRERMGEKAKNGEQHLAKQLLMSLLIAM